MVIVNIQYKEFGDNKKQVVFISSCIVQVNYVNIKNFICRRERLILVEKLLLFILSIGDGL